MCNKDEKEKQKMFNKGNLEIIWDKSSQIWVMQWDETFVGGHFGGEF